MSAAGGRGGASVPTARKYTEVRLPWFEYYDGDRTALEGAKQLAGLDDCAFVCRCPDVPPERREFASVAPRTYETAHHLLPGYAAQDLASRVQKLRCRRLRRDRGDGDEQAIREEARRDMRSAAGRPPRWSSAMPRPSPPATAASADTCAEEEPCGSRTSRSPTAVAAAEKEKHGGTTRGAGRVAARPVR